MKRFSAFLFAIAIVLLPAVASAQTTLVYPETLSSYNFDVLSPASALYAPDNQYADFLRDNAQITVDFGMDVTSDITLHYTLLDVYSGWQVTFLDENMAILGVQSAFFSTGTNSVTATYTGTAPYRFVKILSFEDGRWKLDAIEASVEVEEEPEPEPTNEEEPEEEEVPTDDPNRGTLITLPDDGNAQTHHDEAVYVIGADGSRHPFPNEDVFFSWYKNFDHVLIVGETEMASRPLGANVTMRAGTNLVKITTDPRVFAVEPGAVLRWISSEEIAEELYGEDWAARVHDVPDVFWGNYSLGDDILSAVHPTGTIGVELSTGEVLYIQNATYYSLDQGVYEGMRIQPGFYVGLEKEQLDLYVDGGVIRFDPDLAYPY